MLQKLIRQMEKLLSRSRFGIFIYARPYRAVIEREWGMLDLPPQARIVFVGAGAIPFTAIWLVRLYHCHVDAFDLDEEAIKRASRVVKKLKLSPYITLHHGSVTTALSSYDAAIVALQVKPLQTVIETLWSTGTHRVIVRRPSHTYRDAYDVLPNTYAVDDRVEHPFRALAASALLKHPSTSLND
ncbi:MAG: hypothetical protein EA374_02385 [Acholeplasmatales bacterium]|nr:MAG: hypothetical protein EA374_02385 [Acholeplasmatales bacterium]